MQGYLITAGPLSTIGSSLEVRSWLLLLDQVADEVPCQRLDVHPGYLRERLRRLDDAGQHVPRVGVHGDPEAGERRDGVEEGAPVDLGYNSIQILGASSNLSLNHVWTLETCQLVVP